MQFNVFIFICFVNGACRGNPILYFKISKNGDFPLKNELIITSKEVTVEILVYEILPAQSHEIVTLDQLICYNNKSNQIMFNNLNFAYVKKYLTANYTRYMYRSTQELKIPRGSNGPWEWLCKLYVHWNRSNVDYEFEVEVAMLEKNESNDTVKKIPLHEHHAPATPKQLTKNEPKNIKPTSDFNKDIGAAKNHLESTDKMIPNKNPERGKEKQTTEPKSVSSGITEETPRDQKGKNQKPTEKNNGMDLDIGVIPNTLKKVNVSSSQVAYSETSTSTTWVILVVAAVVVFIVGLAIGAICRRPPPVVGTTAPMPDPPEQIDEQTDEHIYEEVVDKGIRNRPPLPIPEKAVYIYNSPYDHTLWFQNQSALN